MDENELLPQEEQKESEQEQKPEAYKNAKERLYDKIPISVKTLDVIIKLLFAAIAVALVLGIIAGRS